MANEFSSFIRGGVDQVFAGFIDSSGLTGATANAPSSGAAGSGLFRVKGIKTANPAVPAPEVVSATGDDTVQGTFVFDSPNPQSFQITKSVFDLALEARFQDTLTEVIGEGTFGIQRPAAQDYPDFCWILQSRAKKKDAGVDGRKAWSGFIIPITNVFPTGVDQLQERTVATDTLTIAVSPFDRTPLGYTLRDTIHGTEVAHMIPFDNGYPYHMKTFVGDGTTTTFNLDYIPVSVAQTVAYVAGVKNAIAVNSVSVSNKTFTLASAPGNGVRFFVIYGFQPS